MGREKSLGFFIFKGSSNMHYFLVKKQYGDGEGMCNASEQIVGGSEWHYRRGT